VNAGSHGKIPSKINQINLFLAEQNEFQNIIAPASFYPTIPSRHFLPFDEPNSLLSRGNLYIIKRQAHANCLDIENSIISEIKFGNSSFILSRYFEKRSAFQEKEAKIVSLIINWLNSFDTYHFLLDKHPRIVEIGYSVFNYSRTIFDYSRMFIRFTLNETLRSTLEDNFVRKPNC
jgi:hypothetical protein